MWESCGLSEAGSVMAKSHRRWAVQGTSWLASFADAELIRRTLTRCNTHGAMVRLSLLSKRRAMKGCGKRHSELPWGWMIVRRASKTDTNQSAIVAALRTVGCSVLPLHSVGKGCPDLLVASAPYGEMVLIEVKDGDKPPSARKLTPDQVEFHATWRGRIAVVCNVKEALEAVGIPFRGVVS